MWFRPPQFGKVMPQIVTEPGARFLLAQDRHVRLGKGERRYGQADSPLRSKIYYRGTAIAFLLLERLLENEVRFNVDRHCIGFISMRAFCKDPVSSDSQAEPGPCFRVFSSDRAMSVNHAKTTSSNASGPMVR